MLNEILVRVVNSCGFQTISAFDGAQALTVLQQTKVDLVLMDVRFKLILSHSLSVSS